MTPDNFSPPADMPLHASEVYRYCSEIHITTSRAAQINLHKSTKRLILYNFSLKDVTIDWAFFPSNDKQSALPERGKGYLRSVSMTTVGSKRTFFF